VVEGAQNLRPGSTVAIGDGRGGAPRGEGKGKPKDGEGGKAPS